MSFAQARRVAAFSWPLYVAAFCLAVLVGGMLPLIGNSVLRGAAALIGLVVLWWAGASFWAFHVMFDKSNLLSGSWLCRLIAKPERWVQFTTGLEQTSLPIESLFPAAEGRVVDVYDEDVMTEPALTRARKRHSSEARALQSGKIESGWGDLVVVMLTAHEIRRAAERERLFEEVARIASQEGLVVLVEHLRDLAAAITFGPGVFHFYPRTTWLRLAASAELHLEDEFSITPFVRVFCLRHSTTANANEAF